MSTSPINSFEHFLLWEQASRDAIMVKRVYIDMSGDVIAGLMLSQIIYWHLPNDQGKSRLRVFKDGYFWLAKGYSDWWDECRLTVDQARRALKILHEKGLVVTTLKHFNGVPTVHIRIDEERFLEAVSLFGLKPEWIRDRTQMDLASNPNGSGLEPKSYKQTLQTDTTTDTTAAASTALDGRPKRRQRAAASAAVLDFEEIKPLCAEAQTLADRLHAAGLNRADAEKFARSKPEEAARQLEYLPFKADVEKPGGWLRRAIEGGFGPPDSYVQAKKQKAAEERKRAQATTAAQKQEAKEAFAREAAIALDAEIESLDTRDAAEFEAFVENECQRRTARFPSQRIRETMTREFAKPETRRELYREWQQARVPSEAARMPVGTQISSGGINL